MWANCSFCWMRTTLGALTSVIGPLRAVIGPLRPLLGELLPGTVRSKRVALNRAIREEDYIMEWDASWKAAKGELESARRSHAPMKANADVPGCE